MVSQPTATNELYNLRWNSYYSNLINVFTEHQNQESLVDVTLGCEGQFIKAHKLILSACSIYFQKIFQTHTSSQLLVLLNDVKFSSLRLVVQFMYKGEVKVADSDLQSFLQLGKMLQVKGLSSVELQEKQKTETNGEMKVTNKEAEVPSEKKTNETTQFPEKDINDETKLTKSENKKANSVRVIMPEKEEVVPVKKRKLPSPVPPEPKKKTASTSIPEKEKKTVSTSTPEKEKKTVSISTPVKDVSRIPRPPNAFMIFANLWRKKLAVEYPTESNKDISVRLGNMWKSLAPETRDAFYEDARKADEEHKLKYPGYYYSPKEARHRKAVANITKAAQKLDSSKESVSDSEDTEYIEIKCEDNDTTKNSEHSTPKSNGSN